MESTIGSNWTFAHVAVVVRDMDKEVKGYESLGIGTFRPETVLDSSEFSDYRVYGKATDTVDKSRFRHNDIGQDNFDLELISPVEGKPIYTDFLNNQGEGLHHIAFFVKNLNEEIAKLAEKDVPIINKVTRPDGSGFAYLDLGNIIIELIQRRKPNN